MLKATEIQWVIDDQDVYERIEDDIINSYMNDNNCSRDQIPDSIKDIIIIDRFLTHKDYYTRLKEDSESLNSFMKLPDEVEVPLELTEREDISIWLSDTYGFCHNGFIIKEVD